MITIKAPIELKIRSDLATGYDAFGERIAGNYALMGLEIGEEELLHMVSAPPEIYLMDGESTTIGGNTFISSRNEEKYSIVNNMLNRIMLSVNGDLTYQDRTYITDALHKLGIRDDRRFMTEVKRMIRESHLEEDFLNNYFEMVLEGENRELRERTLELSKELVRSEMYRTESNREDFLSENILHRLQTGAIYQIVSNFNKSLSDTRIELQESMLSEQENVARKLLVQNFLSNVIKEEPELILAATGPSADEAETDRVIREIPARKEEQPAGPVREEHTRILEQGEREYRTSEQFLSERESVERTERESAELVYRETETGTPETTGAPGETTERVILEKTRVEAPGAMETSILEKTTEGTTQSIPSVQREEGEAATPETKGAPYTEPAGESSKERLTEREIRSTERYDTDQLTERTGRYVTERESDRLTERESAEIVYREGESREQLEETLLDRLTERTAEEKERLTELQEEERITSERTERETGQDVRTERVTSETILQEGTESAAPGKEIPGSITERVIQEGESLIERTEAELRTEHTDRYVTEQGEILRTEHEGAELIYREGEAPAVSEAERIPSETERLRETVISESERIREAGETAGSEQRIPVAPGERVTEERSRTNERESSEYHTIERTSTEPGTVLRAEQEVAETPGKPGRETTVPGEQISEKIREEFSSELISERERTEAELRTEHTDRYVTEQGEILRTEHEGAELIYREGEAPAVSEAEGIPSETERLRETVISESERIRVAVETAVSAQVIPGAPGERVTEERSRTTERESSEHHTIERTSTEPGTVLRAEQEVAETPSEPGRETTVPGEQISEKIREELTSELTTERERTEAELRTEHTDRYVTEQGEILRTEHEGAELIYREGAGTEPETGEVLTEETIRLIREAERDRITERERLEKERSSSLTREELASEVRSELREQLESERSRTEQIRSEKEREIRQQADLVYREGITPEDTLPGEEKITQTVRETLETERERISDTERLERERTSSRIRETAESAVRDELREQIRTERIRTEGTGAGATAAPGRTYERSELIYRRESPSGTEGAAPGRERRTREIERYRSDNVYEREILEKERTRTEVTSGIKAAVLLDVVKTLFHAGYDKIGRGDSWIEMRGALYHSAENTFNRLNYNLDQRVDTQITNYPEPAAEVNMDFSTLEELQEITENAGDVETIENTIREMNEMNLQNVERYQQMVEVLKNLRPERRRTGGMERTRQEALNLLDDEQALYESMQYSEDAQEAERREVFHEITRIFPEQSVEIFKVVEQYLDGTAQPGRVGITRNEVEAAAEEIRRITATPVVVPEPVPEPVQTESSELIYRRNDRVTQEELQEMMESFRRSENLQRREIEQRDQQMETQRRNTTTVTTNSMRTLSRQEAEDIEALVSRGVRSQMSAISEQVLQKLEKKLKNEKIRRGI